MKKYQRGESGLGLIFLIAITMVVMAWLAMDKHEELSHIVTGSQLEDTNSSSTPFDREKVTVVDTKEGFVKIQRVNGEFEVYRINPEFTNRFKYVPPLTNKQN